LKILHSEVENNGPNMEVEVEQIVPTILKEINDHN